MTYMMRYSMRTQKLCTGVRVTDQLNFNRSYIFNFLVEVKA